MTKQKKIILDIIKENYTHLTAEEVFIKAKILLPKIAIGTVYNNLNALSEENIIRRIKIYNGRDVFDYNTFPHEHLVCDNCQKVKDIVIDNFIENIQNKEKVKVTSYDLILHYTCNDCNSK